MTVKIKQDVYKGWNSWWVEHGPLTLVLVPQVGGRIMGKRWHGHELAFVGAELAGQVHDTAAVKDLHGHKHEHGFPLWGGDKTWLAPQPRWTDGVPFLDLDSGLYRLDIDTAEADTVTLRMTSPVCRETGVELTRTLTLAHDTPGWILTHGMRNCSTAAVEWGLWDVDMVLRPARVFLPTRANSPYPDGVKTYENEGESAMLRDRVVTHRGSTAIVDCGGEGKFKYGVDGELGSIFAILDVAGLGLVGYRKRVPTYHPRPYGHSCVAEVFHDPFYNYLELEVHGPLVQLQPGESFELSERCELFDLPAWPPGEEEVRGYLER